MIVPQAGFLRSISLEQEVAEWVDGVNVLGYAEDWDGHERPGLPVAIAENLPSNEAPAIHAWDIPVSMAEVFTKIAPRHPLAYWLFGPSNYETHKRAVADTN